MLQQSGHELVSDTAQALLSVRVLKHIFASLEQRHVDVHARSCHSEKRLRHEGGVEAMFTGDCFDDKLECLDVVARPDGVRVFEIDLMLARGVLMVGSLDFEAERFQFEHDIPAAIFAKVGRRKVKVAAIVVQLEARFPVHVELEKEEFRLRPDIEFGEPELFHFLEHALQVASRVPFKRCPVRTVDVTDQTCHFT